MASVAERHDVIDVERISTEPAPLDFVHVSGIKIETLLAEDAAMLIELERLLANRLTPSAILDRFGFPSRRTVVRLPGKTLPFFLDPHC